jgi:uncharacterized protein YjbJ (UPF0337 family)
VNQETIYGEQSPYIGGLKMNKEQVSGKVDELKGRVKEEFGKATNNPDTQAEGLVDQGKGKVKQTYGDIKEELKDQRKP